MLLSGGYFAYRKFLQPVLFPRTLSDSISTVIDELVLQSTDVELIRLLLKFKAEMKAYLHGLTHFLEELKRIENSQVDDNLKVLELGALLNSHGNGLVRNAEEMVK